MQMGHAAAQAVVKAGLNLLPYTITGDSVAAAKGNVIGVSGVPVAVVGLEEREEVLLRLKEDNPEMIIIDFTLPMCVNGEYCSFVDLCEFLLALGTMGLFSKEL